MTIHRILQTKVGLQQRCVLLTDVLALALATGLGFDRAIREKADVGFALCAFRGQGAVNKVRPDGLRSAQRRLRERGVLHGDESATRNRVVSQFDSDNES
jgi:hypothetical protein